MRRDCLKSVARLVVIAVVVIICAYYSLNSSSEERTEINGHLIPVKLVKTIDGDTIKIIYEGKEQNLRYLLIDTPETNHPQLGKQPFGEKAKERNRELVNSGKLEIEFDIGE